jgi:asparagine synthase (glutamine-hydrolysing)
VAASCGQPHQTIPLDDPFFPEFTKLAERAVFLTDGAMDVTGAAELYVNALARRIAPVRLTGNYGSETVRSNVAFRPRGFPEDALSTEIRRHVGAAAGTYAHEAKGDRLSFIAFKQVPWHHFARFAVERSQLTIRSPFLDNDLLALLFRAPPTAATSLTPSLRLIAEGNPKLGEIPTDRGIEFNTTGVTRSRTHLVQEFLAKAEYAYDYGMPDWLARMDSWLSPLQLERVFLGRQKFCHFRSWYRQALASQVKDVLLDRAARTRAHIGGAGLETMINDHVAGRSNHTLAIHKLLSLEFVHRKLLAA